MYTDMRIHTRGHTHMYTHTPETIFLFRVTTQQKTGQPPGTTAQGWRVPPRKGPTLHRLCPQARGPPTRRGSLRCAPESSLPFPGAAPPPPRRSVKVKTTVWGGGTRGGGDTRAEAGRLLRQSEPPAALARPKTTRVFLKQRLPFPVPSRPHLTDRLLRVTLVKPQRPAAQNTPCLCSFATAADSLPPSPPGVQRRSSELLTPRSLPSGSTPRRRPGHQAPASPRPLLNCLQGQDAFGGKSRSLPGLRGLPTPKVRGARPAGSVGPVSVLSPGSGSY